MMKICKLYRLTGRTRYMDSMILRIAAVLLAAALVTTGSTCSAFGAEGSRSGHTPSGIPYSQLEHEIDSYVNSYIGKSTPGAAVVVTRGDRIIFSKGYGYANIEQKVPVDPSRTVFSYGSINKMFVWTSVMQLVEQGKMRLDQDIKTYLPKDLGDKLRYKSPITMLDIMSHTAGFEQHPLSLFIRSADDLKPLEETLLSVQPEQIYEPGSVIAYSNYSTALAALTVEKVSGQDFPDYEMNHILRPLGMLRTSGHPSLKDHPELKKDKAEGYAAVEQEGFTPRGQYYIPLYPAGAMEGTAEDLARFAIALTTKHNPLFSRTETLHAMLSRSYTPDKDLLSNAHGFWEYSGSPRAVGHSGNTMGFSSNFAIVPEEKLGIVVLTNAEIEQSLTAGLVNHLIQNKHAISAESGGPLQRSSDVAGHYVIAQNSYTTVQEVLSYLGLIKAEAKGEFDLTVRVMGMFGEYKQIHPQLYQLTHTEYPRLKKLAPLLYAEMLHGKVIRLSKGIATDIVPLPPGRSLPALISYLALAVLCILFFVITPAVLLVRRLLSCMKGKGLSSSNPSGRWTAAASTGGAAVVLNSAVLLMNAAGNQDATVGQLNTGIMINWILAILAEILLVTAIYKGRRQSQTRGQKWLQMTTALLLNSFLILLSNWHFFHFID
ncbi:serine hydrolase domain-containing protein [Paenibacillus sp. YPG26]|uniref:serine hydrolase domain-containing protein n=1 Tax=Paenibacillus sp. YPG26 TaxID=2878915 RepID=UPI00203C3EC6|nr:serine hydrolase domain-containing protein [Paenibacillus sp. YPG26]USB34354.1 beta-lactamase family protein [Paenibacillus sp. YPG26]